MENLDIIAIIVAALANFALGGLWYGPLFGKAWIRANGFTEAEVQRLNPLRAAIIALIPFLIMAGNLAAFVSAPGTSAGFTLAASFAAGFGWAAMGLTIVALFEGRGWLYIAVNGGYLVAAFLLMGGVLAILG